MRGVTASIFLVLALGLASLGPAAAAENAQQVNVEQIRRGLTGTWQSLDDTRFTRQLNADGTSVDRYEGDESATSAGSWKLVEGTALPPDLAARKLPAEGFYLTLTEHGDLYLFALTALNPQAMEVINLDRKQTLSFVRLK
jgi:hypothetical protein